ncbi:MAG: type IV secretory system conjugative DNA transfer family protein [Butyribacter sp.]|nr:type IV secretory system conjugative DNA transfer family protein [bacterium]MDY3854814.1 type IV secretory system conjugative DNA transfer family protein [Butyribacter sp.]
MTNQNTILRGDNALQDNTNETVNLTINNIPKGEDTMKNNRTDNIPKGENTMGNKSTNNTSNNTNNNRKAGKEIMKNTKKQEANGIPMRILAHNQYVSNNDIATGLNNNDLIIGGSGAGKTGGYVIPNVKQQYGSMIVTDTKGNLHKKLRKELKEAGYEVKVLDFVHPEQSCGYNPFDYIRRDEQGNYREKDVVSLANTLCPVLDSKEPFWEMTARTVLQFLIGFTMEYFPEEEQNLSTVLEVYKEVAKSNPEMKMFFKDWTTKHPDSFASRKYRMFAGCKDADKTWSCVMQFVGTAIDCFEFSDIQPMIKNQNEVFRIETLGRKKTVLFLNVSDTDRAFDKLVNIFYTQALQVLCDEADANENSRLDVPVRFFLDDFAANVYIENFDKIISVIRSRNISVSVILQSMTQLEAMYREASAATIVNNCDHIVYLGGQDMKTARFIGARINKTEDKVLEKPLDKVYILTAGAQGVLADKFKPYTEIQRVLEPEREKVVNAKTENVAQNNTINETDKEVL